jgi:hypothetical protein
MSARQSLTGPKNFGPGYEIEVLLESGKRRFPGRKDL